MSGSALNEYVAHLVGRSPHTVAGYRRVAAAFLDQAGPPPFGTRPVLSYLSAISECNSLASVATKTRALRSFLSWGVRRDLCTQEAVELCVPPKFPRMRPTIATPEEVTTLMSAAPQRLRTPILLASALGLRESEIRTLRWGAVDLTPELECITVIGKGSKLRALPLVDAGVVAYLKEHQGAAEEYVWPGECGSERHRSSFGKALGRLCEEAGLRHLNPHALRHGFSQTCAVSGVSSAIISRMLGHSSLHTTELYLQGLQDTETLRAGLQRVAVGG